MKMKIYINDPDITVAELLGWILVRSGHVITTEISTADLVITEWKMNGIPAIAILSKLRQYDYKSKWIIFTSRDGDMSLHEHVCTRQNAQLIHKIDILDNLKGQGII